MLTHCIVVRCTACSATSNFKLQVKNDGKLGKLNFDVLGSFRLSGRHALQSIFILSKISTGFVLRSESTDFALVTKFKEIEKSGGEFDVVLFR